MAVCAFELCRVDRGWKASFLTVSKAAQFPQVTLPLHTSIRSWPADSEYLSNAIVVIQAAISRSAGRGDPVRSIVAGKLRFSVLCLNGLSFVACGHRSLPQRWLMACCEQLYLHVVFILTLPSIAPLVNAQPSLDLEGHLKGTHHTARSLLYAQRHSTSPWMNALPMLPLRPALRSTTSQLLASVDFPGTLFSILSVGRHLVTFTQGQQRQLAPADAQLLVNYALSHHNTRTNDNMFTVCLPHLAPHGTVQMGVAHVGSISRSARTAAPPSVQSNVAGMQSWGGSVGLHDDAPDTPAPAAAAGAAGSPGFADEAPPAAAQPAGDSAHDSSQAAAPAGPKNLPLLMKVADEMLASAAQSMNRPVEQAATAALGLPTSAPLTPASPMRAEASPPEGTTVGALEAPASPPSTLLSSPPDGDLGLEDLLLESKHEDVFLIAVTTEISSSAFSLLRSARQRLRSSLEEGKPLHELCSAVQSGGVHPERMGVPGLLHFAYMWKPLQQSVESAMPEGFVTGWHRRRLVARYARIFERLTGDMPTLRHVVDGGDEGVLHAGLHSTNAILLATWRREGVDGAPPRATGELPRAMEALAKALQSRHEFLFVTKPAQPRRS